uniref:Uncharacterized protein n=1 Tax=Streptomyces sp. NBC_01393 TaxID=2903851 RepID=A0AAU3HVI0_9ACTN
MAVVLQECVGRPGAVVRVPLIAWWGRKSGAARTTRELRALRVTADGYVLYA